MTRHRCQGRLGTMTLVLQRLMSKENTNPITGSSRLVFKARCLTFCCSCSAAAAIASLTAAEGRPLPWWTLWEVGWCVKSIGECVHVQHIVYPCVQKSRTLTSFPDHHPAFVSCSMRYTYIGGSIGMRQGALYVVSAQKK